MKCLNPFGTGRSLSTEMVNSIGADTYKFQSLWSRAGSFDSVIGDSSSWLKRFQSLWSRAGFFDDIPKDKKIWKLVSISLAQGGSFDIL